MFSRRNFLRAGATAATAAAATNALSACAPESVPPGLFTTGVASGLHSPTEVVLWTRVEHRNDPSVTEVNWELSDSPNFDTVAATGSAPVRAESDGCVKVLVGGLDADSNYWYRFVTGDRSTVSPIGRARTLPRPEDEPASLRLAFAACQSYASGYYGAWRGIAGQDLDAVVFLGDYIYESFPIQIGRRVRDETVRTATGLDDYRARYRHYRSDEHLRAAHAAHPLVPIWDDHEVTNDYNSSIRLTDPDRLNAAYQAWFEYMPVWPIDDTRIYRNLQWGTLSDLFLLDGRQYRDARPEAPSASVLGLPIMTQDLAAPGRTMLGDRQRRWLLDGLTESSERGSRWRLIANPVMIAPVRLQDLDTPEFRRLDPDLPRHAGLYLGTDSWDGFGWERDQVLDHLLQAEIDHVAFLTGDFHSFLGAALSTDFDDPRAPIVAYEYTGGSISSPSGVAENLLGAGFGSLITSPGFDYTQMQKQGYGLVECTPESMTVTFHELDAMQPWAVPVPAVRFTTPRGATRPTVTRL